MVNRLFPTFVHFGFGFVALTALVSSASAQSVQLDHFRMAETSDDGFYVSRPSDRGHLNLGLNFAFDYARAPLVVETVSGDMSTQSTEVIGHQLVGAASLSLGLWDRLVIFGGLPVTLFADGEYIGIGGPDAGYPGSPALGDAWAGARLRLFGEPAEIFAAALQFTATFPTATAVNVSQAFWGERGVTLVPELLLELRPIAGFYITANAGLRFRPDNNARIDSTVSVTNEFVWGGAVTIPFLRETALHLREGAVNRISGHVEIFGANSFDGVEFANRETSPIEILGGLRFQPADGLTLGLAGGTGLNRGYGAPAYRIVGTIGFAEPSRVPVAQEPPPPVDSDRDGINDDDDTCPLQPEDMDSFEDQDGCPDADNDGDGVADSDDVCPMQAEDRDAFEDDNGCPDPDNDGDGILDDADGCPLVAEDVDGFQDQDGCMEADNDADGIEDATDHCPLDPGARSDNPEENGCPRTVRFDRERGTIIILQRVEFASGRDAVLPQSFPILDEVQGVLSANPQVARVRIEGHTDDRGADRRNLELSTRRARSVVRYLSEHGIAASRLEGWGCGELHPIESNRTSGGRQTNRRVEFHVLDPAPPSGAVVREGCVQAVID